ncbi:MAG: hypothetical protein NC311_06860 [Muribaculaceae bacterium]|nr:hypothetical protein [Muribaculaceae bacterium]MCM1399002.1 hypothetical protein [Clostridium sp.]MCM1458860.1 hypothetical protein [Bacteroides sp.]
MINSFKNFERLRYRISNDIRELAADNKSSNDCMGEEISDTIFATVFSAFVTEVAFNGNAETMKWCAVFEKVLIFILVYISSYVVYNLLHGKWVDCLEKRKIKTVDKSMNAMIQIQKDFDNIACDSILVARDFKSAYENLKRLEENGNIEEDKNLKAFYLFEIMHYLGTACEKTKNLVGNKEKCIRTLNESEGVDIFRVKNIIEIMQELYIFLDSNLSMLNDYTDQKETIEYQHGIVKSLLNKINDNL